MQPKVICVQCDEFALNHLDLQGHLHAAGFAAQESSEVYLTLINNPLHVGLFVPSSASLPHRQDISVFAFGPAALWHSWKTG